MTEVLGSILLVALAVGLGAVFVAAVFATPAPAPSSNAELAAYVMPSDATKLVIEHQGGPAIALSHMRVLVTVGGNATDHPVASSPAWTVTSASGAPRAASQPFSAGDRAVLTHEGMPGRDVRVQVVDGARGVLVLASASVQSADAVKPTVLSARMLSSSSMLVTFSERLAAISPSDFRVAGVAPTSARILGDGATAELVFNATSLAAPALTTVAAPNGTWDPARNVLTGGANVTALAASSLPSAPGAPAATLDPAPLAFGSTTTTLGWPTVGASDSVVRYGPTPALGLVATVPAMVTSHVVPLSNLTPQTVYFYMVTSTNATGVTEVSGVRSFMTRPPSTSPLGAESPLFVSTLFPSAVVKSKPVLLGVNVLNPASTPMSVDWVRINASPSSGLAGVRFFDGTLSSGPGSDVEFNTTACAWSQTVTATSQATCNPGPLVALPAYGMKQLVLSFTTPSTNAGGQWILTVEVGFSSPSGVVVSSHSLNVHFTGGNTLFTGGGAADVVGIYGASGPGGNVTAGRTVAGGAPSQFWWQWTLDNGASTTRTRFTIPAGWTNVSVPHQAESGNVAVAVRQPTATAPGYVDVSQQADTRQLYFVATPPVGVGLDVIEIDLRGEDPEVTSLYSFGVKVT